MNAPRIYHTTETRTQMCKHQLKWTLCKTGNVRTLRCVHVNTAAVVNQYVLHILGVCVALGTHNTKRKRCIIQSSVACLVLSYFSTLSHERYDFRRKSSWTQNVFWFSLQLLSETFLVIRIQRDTIVSVHTSSCKVPAILARVQWQLNSRNPQVPNFMKILPVGAELLHGGQSGGRTRRTIRR